MTILVAVKKNNRIYVGADRITTFGSEYFTDLVDGSKIIKLKNAYLATSGYTLLDNVIEHLHETGHPMMDNEFNDRSQVFSFFLDLYAELKKSYTLVDTGKDTYAGIYNSFVLVTARGIFGVSNNLSVHEYERFIAHGSGSDYALGCLYGTYDSISDGFEVTRLALESACHFSIYCREPLDIIEVKASDFGKKRKYKQHGSALKTIGKRKGLNKSASKRTAAGSGGGAAKRSTKAPAKRAEKGATKPVTKPTTKPATKPTTKRATKRSTKRSR